MLGPGSLHLVFLWIFFYFFLFFFSSLLKWVFTGFWEVLNPFLSPWSWGKCCKTLIRTHLGAFVYEHMKRRSFLAQLCFDHGWLSCPLSSPRRSNSDVNVTQNHLKLVEGIHTFHLDPTLYNLEVYSSTFIRLKLPTWSAKIIKTEVSLSNNVSFTFSSLNLNDMSFMV